MTPTEQRIEALRLAVATVGNSNNVQLAGEYLEFIRGGDDEPKQAPKSGKGNK